MPANWSLTLNILLLIIVMIGIVRLLKSKREHYSRTKNPLNNNTIDHHHSDDIIAVRKINANETIASDIASMKQVQRNISTKISLKALNLSATNNNLLMIFLLAKDRRQLAGYELLQTILAAGLRYGADQLFHRHQHLNGQGPVLCSLATATNNGLFDLQNIGGISLSGLCLFMHCCGNKKLDDERLTIMVDTAMQLADDLDAHLLDQHRQKFSEQSLLDYKDRISKQQLN